MANFFKTDPTQQQGLGTFSYKTTNAGAFTVAGTITLPSVTTGDPASSSVVVTMNVNGGSAFYIGLAGAKGFKAGVTLAANDTVNVILTSAAAVDNLPNAVKTTISIY